jgi:preprotein translocase subunit SecD
MQESPNREATGDGNSEAIDSGGDMLFFQRLSVAAASALLGASALLASAAQTGAKVELRRAESKPAEGLVEAKIEGSDTKIYLHKTADLTNDDIAGASVTDDKTPAIEVIFTKDGKTKAAKLSKEHQGKPLAILVDGKVVMAPILKSELGEKIMITGNFTKAEAEKLAASLQRK